MKQRRNISEIKRQIVMDEKINNRFVEKSLVLKIRSNKPDNIHTILKLQIMILWIGELIIPSGLNKKMSVHLLHIIPIVISNNPITTTVLLFLELFLIITHFPS